MTELIAPYLMAVYAFVCFGMATISWFIKRNSSSRLLDLVFGFWAYHVLNLVVSALTAAAENKRVGAIIVLLWLPLYKKTFGIIREFADIPEVKFEKIIIIGYSISIVLYFTSTPFTLMVLPAVWSLGIASIHKCWLYLKAVKFKNMDAMEKVFFFLIVSFALHMCDWPFLSVHPKYLLLGITYFIFNIIGFAAILPAITLNKLNKTKQIELEKLVEERTEQLLHQSKLSALGEMSAGVAHEINNPLSIIVGRIDQLKRRQSNNELNPELLIGGLNNIESMAFRISRIVKALRDFSRQSPHEPLALTSIHDVLNEILPFCQERFIQNNVKFDIEGELDLKVQCRSLQLSQVFLNLLNNAYDAIEKSKERWIKIKVEKIQDLVRLSFSDGGEGVPSELIHKIMQPFFTTKELGKGTGLGLSISKGIVEDHRGRIYLDTSRPYTAFVVELPYESKTFA